MNRFFKDSQITALDLASHLNSSQLTAATYEDGPLLIVAGAGSGKTRTLVHRVAFLVDKGIPPPAILLLTFTRKTAQEMLGRATALVGKRATQVSGGTFHSLANSLLKPQAHLLGYQTGFSIMDQDDAESLIARIRSSFSEIKRHKRFPQKRALLSIISQAVNKDHPIFKVISENFIHFIEYAPLINQIAKEYHNYKIKNALMDFDDLLTGLEIILSNYEDVRQRLAARYDHILVDEYQDTNPVQARLIYLLGKDHLRVTAVGDDAQSIYAFRGASFRNIMDFPKIFPGAKILKLEENYRSQEPIVLLANHLIAQAHEKYDKTLVAVRGPGLAPMLLVVQDQTDEAGTVAAKIEEFIDQGLQLKDIAVLFRASSLSFDLEIELVRRRIPYTKYGGRKFLESAHIKDFIAFLRCAANPADSISLRRILNMVEGIGLKGAEDIVHWQAGLRERLLDLNSAPLKNKAQKNFLSLAKLMAEISQEGNELALKAQRTAEFYLPKMRDLYPDDWPDRLADLKELLRMAEKQKDLRTFLDDLTLDPPQQRHLPPQGINPGLTLSTVHSAKGLEWKIVFILSAVEGCFPPSYATRSAAEIEEERRLMYVAVTRAKDILFIMLPLGIIDRRTGTLAAPSRFLTALPPTAGAALWQNNRKLDPKELLNIGVNLGYNYKKENLSNFSTFKYRPPAQIKPSVTEATTGQRVCHPIYGVGRVIKINGPKAVIDFDLFGEKSVIMLYAKLTLV